MTLNPVDDPLPFNKDCFHKSTGFDVLIASTRLREDSITFANQWDPPNNCIIHTTSQTKLSEIILPPINDIGLICYDIFSSSSIR